MSIVKGFRNNRTWFEIREIISDKSDKFMADDIGIEVLGSKKEKLIGSLMHKYNLNRVDAEREVAKFWR